MHALLARLSPVFIFACVCQFAIADDQNKFAKIEELMQLTRVDLIHGQLIEQMAASPISQIPTTGTVPEARAAAEEFQRKARALITEMMRWEKMKVEYAKAYDAKFSEEEVDGMLAFYKSRVGRSMLEKMPLVLLLARTQFTNRMSTDRELGQEIQRLAREAFEKSRPSQPH